MAKFHVTVRRVEEVTYEVDATDSAAAEAMPSVPIFMSSFYKAHGAGIQIVGVD